MNLEPRQVRSYLVLLLAVGSGSLDALSYLALGRVFASVITGNLVLLGVGLGDADLGLATSVAIALGAYAAGIAAGAAIAGGAEHGQPPWPRAVTRALSVELVLVFALTVGWELSGIRPSGAARLSLLAVAAASMGLQSAAVNRLDLSGFSSTFLTSTFMRAVSRLVTGPRDGLAVQFAALGAIIAGALAGVALVSHGPAWVPLLPSGVLGLVVLTAAVLGRPGWPFSPDSSQAGGD